MIIKALDSASEKKYDDFLLGSSNTLFFASLKYRNFLREFLGTKDTYLVATDDSGEIKGALPAFLKENSEHGNVLNSLPFYGSNGAVITHDGNEETGRQLIEAFYDLAKENKCVSTTLVSSPLDPKEDLYERHTAYDLKDSRIGQLSPLPDAKEDADAAVMKLIHYKTRNLVRKAQKLNVEVSHGNDPGYLDFLIETHAENLAAIGGIAKPERFFRLVPKHFNYDSDYRIYVARKDGQLVAALLVFYFNKTVEYYTPVIKAEYRSSQALSLLIFEAMKDGVRAGYNWWNWGGTWASQGGVYHFKSQWGTQDKNYYYYTKISGDDILKKTKEQLLEAYPYFFVAPFNALVTAI